MDFVMFFLPSNMHSSDLFWADEIELIGYD